MTELKNDRYLRALLRQPVDVTPVWMMRQAGRYLPEYKATRAQAGDFMSLCKNAELACEVTLQPLRRYALDAAILFSDILTIPDAMGLGLYFETGEGPRFTSTITCKADVDKLPVPDPEDELGYVMNAVRTIRRELKGEVPLIGFSGSPWTLATYMVEGGSSKAFTVIKKMMYADPQALHALLEKLAKSVTLYLNAQIKAGAQSVMIFDTWGGVLTGRDYQQFSLYYMHKIVDGLLRENEGRRVPVTLFTKAADSGWKRWPKPAVMRWVSTGPPISPMRAAASVTKWRCRAIWTLPCSMRLRAVLKKKSRPYWPALVRERAMSSTSVMASIRM
ncbi:Uroporphyrinogen decarboxylase [Raoultella ornithinolytica]|nr:Uroporphyrinogen decarboxylase [Raoultella ornithinolytica]